MSQFTGIITLIFIVFLQNFPLFGFEISNDTQNTVDRMKMGESNCELGLYNSSLSCFEIPHKTKDSDEFLILPKNFQVFQRATLTQGSIKIRLKLDSKAKQVLVSIKSISELNPALHLYQSSNVVSKNTFTYEQTINLSAGGWYSIDIYQILEGSNLPIKSSQSHFGVGDIFITAGQSNSVNSGEKTQRTNSGLVVAFDPKSETWNLGNDPQPGYYDNFLGTASGGSTWPNMGDILVASTKVPIAIVTTGYGATSVGQWQKGHSAGHFSRLVTIMNQVIEQSGGIRMILWHQGESDVIEKTSSNEYLRLFKKLMKDLSMEFGGLNFSWMIATASFVPDWGKTSPTSGAECPYKYVNERYAQGIVSAQLKLISEGAVLKGPNTDDLIGPSFRYSGPYGGCIHFSTQASIVVGQRWATQILKASFSPTRSLSNFVYRYEVFQSKWYLQHYPDLEKSFGTNQFLVSQHWLIGVNEGRQGSPDFWSKIYLQNYSDLSGAFGNNNYLEALRHFVIYGRAEGRSGI